MNEILAYAHSNKDEQWIYACGYRWTNPTQETYSNAATMKFSVNGDLEYVDVWSRDKIDQKDFCRAASYDEKNNIVVFLMEVTSNELRPSYSSYYRYSSSNSDLLIVQMY